MRVKLIGDSALSVGVNLSGNSFVNYGENSFKIFLIALERICIVIHIHINNNNNVLLMVTIDVRCSEAKDTQPWHVMERNYDNSNKSEYTSTKTLHTYGTRVKLFPVFTIITCNTTNTTSQWTAA